MPLLLFLEREGGHASAAARFDWVVTGLIVTMICVCGHVDAITVFLVVVCGAAVGHIVFVVGAYPVGFI